MRKIGGIKMSTMILRREHNIQETLKQSLKEVKLHKEGKIQLKTWDELYEELNQYKEK